MNLTNIAINELSSKWIEKEYKYSPSNYKPLPVVITKGKGIKLWDIEGNKYYDFLSAYSCVNQGHCHPKIIAAMEEQIKKLSVCSRAFHNDMLARCQEILCNLFNYEKVIMMNSGAEGMETATKVARKWAYKKKGIAKDQAKIIVLEQNFHGRTLNATSASTGKNAEFFGPLLEGYIKIPFNDIEAMEKATSIPNVCAVLIEPIQGEAGIHVPKDGYLEATASLCREKNILFIADEIQTGLGRTGKLLACDYEKVRPDLLILGKSLSGGIYPISAVLGDKKTMGVLEVGDHGSTFGGNPLASAIAIAALEVLEEEKLTENAFVMGEIFRKEINKIIPESKFLKEVRGKGLFNAIEVNEIKGADTALGFCCVLKENGILAKPTRSTIIRFTPPLVISEKQLMKACHIIQQTALIFERTQV